MIRAEFRGGEPKREPCRGWQARPGRAAPPGITKSSLTTESFISLRPSRRPPGPHRCCLRVPGSDLKGAEGEHSSSAPDPAGTGSNRTTMWRVPGGLSTTRRKSSPSGPRARRGSPWKPGRKPEPDVRSGRWRISTDGWLERVECRTERPSTPFRTESPGEGPSAPSGAPAPLAPYLMGLGTKRPPPGYPMSWPLPFTSGGSKGLATYPSLPHVSCPGNRDVSPPAT